MGASEGPPSPKARRGSEGMEITRNGSRSVSEGSADRFKGKVRIELLFKASRPGRTQGVSVTFEPGARNSWHSHPAGQVLIVTAGQGVIQTRGGSVEHIGPGDVVVCPPDENHWHGATPDGPMTHIAIQGEVEGRVVDWEDEIPDKQRPTGVRGTS
jgi:quercetin dioxygenase-like cupin family protein